MRLPDFIIGGAPRAGTTWLYWLLDRHPSIYMAKPFRPEPKFFLVDHLYANGLEYYSKTWFSDLDPKLRAGEKSTDYLESQPAAERIARDLPDVKLIFLLRDPVERAFSNYCWTKMNGLESEDFQTALELEDRRERELPERLRFARPYSYFSRGLYADLLQPYLARFARSQMLILRFEDIISVPDKLATQVHQFLDVESRAQDASGLGVINPSERPQEMPDDLRRELAERYAEPNRRLAALLGPSFTLWRS